jgi:hypothetical protein
MFCPQCGKNNPPDAKFCFECAFPLKEITPVLHKDLPHPVMGVTPVQREAQQEHPGTELTKPDMTGSSSQIPRISRISDKAKTGLIFFVLIILVLIIFLAAQTGFSPSPAVNASSNPNSAPLVSVTPTPVPSSESIITVLPTPQPVKNDTNTVPSIIEYKYPEKITQPEDLSVGDIIQMSVNDSRYDRDHACILDALYPEKNELLLSQIVRFKAGNDNQWFGIGTANSRQITFGALMRDYPYKIGHSSVELPQKCLVCQSGDMARCIHDDLVFIDCSDPQYLSWNGTGNGS